MKRRDFLKLSAPLAASPLLLNGLSLKAFATQSMLQTLGCEDVGDRVLVLIQLKGGNDGLNMLVPIAQYADYANLRPDIRIKDSGSAGQTYINLDSTLSNDQLTGLHPAMTAVKNLYDSGKVSIINSVGYPVQNKSHFKSTDLWLTGGDGTPANFNHSTGWVGRYLDYSFPGIAGNPNALMPDPLGIELGDRRPSLGFHTESEHRTSINLTGQDPSGFYNVVSEIGNAPLLSVPDSDYGDILQFVMNLENSMSVYSQRISEVFDNGTNSATYPQSNLANQLKTVARLMAGGCKTKIYLTSINGFDTHINQIQGGSTHLGVHANLLQQISEAVAAFQTDLLGLGIEDRVMTVTFSEFGRKAIQNGSFGTDHGTVAPMLIFGRHLEAGVFGNHPDLQNLDPTGAPGQAPEYDYRQVFTTLLQDWLGASSAALAASYFDPYETTKIDVIDSEQVVPPECYDPFINSGGNTSLEEAQSANLRAYPNPTTGPLLLEFELTQAQTVAASLLNLQGQVVRHRDVEAYPGENQLSWQLDQLPAGVYVCELRGEDFSASLRISKI